MGKSLNKHVSACQRHTTHRCIQGTAAAEERCNLQTQVYRQLQQQPRALCTQRCRSKATEQLINNDNQGRRNTNTRLYAPHAPFPSPRKRCLPQIHTLLSFNRCASIYTTERVIRPPEAITNLCSPVKVCSLYTRDGFLGSRQRVLLTYGANIRRYSTRC